MRSIGVRLSLLAAGGAMVAYGLQLMHRGVLVYQNTWFRGTNYSAGTVAAGVFVGLLAFLPPTSWVDRWMARRKKKPQQNDHPAFHQRHHGPK
ncbi:MAG: hypothetical protein ABSG72_23360 [Candidatus Sulfotelmatobacter sp.]|jgi:hypothetical protein